MATCGSIRPKLLPELKCILSLDHAGDHKSGYGGLDECWPNRGEGMSYLNPSDMPHGRQAQEEWMNGAAGEAKEATHASEPQRPTRQPPLKAPVGNQHPDTSRWAAEKVSKTLRNQQLPAAAWVLSVVEDWGIGEQNTAYWYNQFLLPLIDHGQGRPPKPLHNEMGSRLQAMRGYGTNPVHGPPWVVYVQDREPCGPNEKMSAIKDRPGEKALARININGNPSCVQRLTDAPDALEAVRKVEQKLIDKYGEQRVAEMKREIRQLEGLPG